MSDDCMSMFSPTTEGPFVTDEDSGLTLATQGEFDCRSCGNTRTGMFYPDGWRVLREEPNCCDAPFYRAEPDRQCIWRMWGTRAKLES